MSTSNAQLIITARDTNLRVRGNGIGPITASDHRSFANAVIEAVENLDNKPSGEDAVLFMDATGQPAEELGAADSVVVNTVTGDIWQKQPDGAWLHMLTIPLGAATFTPVTAAELSANAVNVAGLGLRAAILALANAGGGGTTTPTPAVTPTAPTVTFNSSTRVLTASHTQYAAAQLEYKQGAGAYQAYAPVSVDDNAHNAGEWQFRVKAATGRNAGAPAGSPAITAATAPPTSGTLTVAGSDYIENVWNIAQPGGWSKVGAHAVLPFSTNATSLTCVVKNLLGSGPLVTISVFTAAGVYCGYFQPSGPVDETLTFVGTLPGTGTRDFYLRLGGTSSVGLGPTEFNGVTVTSLTAVNGTIGLRTVARKAKRAFNLGDSKSIGDKSTNASRLAMMPQLQGELGDNWEVAAAGAGAWYPTGILGSPALVDDMAQRTKTYLEGAAEQHVMYTLGTNNIWYTPASPAAAAAAGAAYWDAVHALLPGAVIHVQKIPPRTDHAETEANSLGYVFADYNAALQQAVSTRPYCVFENNDGVIDPATDLADGLHEKDQGYLKMAWWWASILTGQATRTTIRVGETVQDYDPRLVYSAGWTPFSNAGGGVVFRGGTIKYTMTAGATCDIPTEGGTQIALNAYTDNSGGMLELLHNGAVIGTYSMKSNEVNNAARIVSPVVAYAAVNTFQVRKQGSADMIWIDEVEVTDGTQVPTPQYTFVFQEGDEIRAYNATEVSFLPAGAWANNSNLPTVYGSQKLASAGADRAYTFTMNASQLRFKHTLYELGVTFEVLFDNVVVAEFSQYGPSTTGETGHGYVTPEGLAKQQRAVTVRIKAGQTFANRYGWADVIEVLVGNNTPAGAF
ncbi:hypothetical protein LJ737_19960 [Hymenobacter sp. 15J16-1T3B]|uniref:hypothetical protein n=1 Tax=Hymenobacter sp. 15J16-1T3B TaxID=2886941 RepID=UPI001D118BA1|nr:hypothetical protein [Hymenobacter sp. 15J16-1T3B]MCC3159528.1 hypothetical protein [Hymenobacter sp. 15J16-1T3B]